MIEYTIEQKNMAMILRDGRMSGSRLTFEMPMVKIYIKNSTREPLRHHEINALVTQLAQRLHIPQGEVRRVRKITRKKSKIDPRQKPLF